MFVNYTPHTGITVSRSRHPGAYYGEISDVALAVTYNHESCCCAMEGALATLGDSAYWQDFRVTPEALGALHDAIREATDNPDPGNPVLCASITPDA